MVVIHHIPAEKKIKEHIKAKLGPLWPHLVSSVAPWAGQEHHQPARPALISEGKQVWETNIQSLSWELLRQINALKSPLKSSEGNLFLCLEVGFLFILCRALSVSSERMPPTAEGVHLTNPLQYNLYFFTFVFN